MAKTAHGSVLYKVLISVACDRGVDRSTAPWALVKLTVNLPGPAAAVARVGAAGTVACWSADKG